MRERERERETKGRERKGGICMRELERKRGKEKVKKEKG